MDEQVINSSVAAPGVLPEFGVLAHLSAALGASTDLETSLRVLLARLAGAFHADGVECRVLAGADEWRLLAQHALDTSLQAINLRRRAVQEISEYAFRQAEPVYVSDFGSTAHYARRELARTTGFTGLLLAPLIADEKPVGTLSLYYREPHELSPVERTLLDSLGRQLAVHIARARQYETEHTRLENLHQAYVLLITLSRASAQLQAQLGSDELPQILIHELLRVRLHSALLVPDRDQNMWRVRVISLLPQTLAMISKFVGADVSSLPFPMASVPRLKGILEKGYPLLLRDVPLAAQSWLPKLGRSQLKHVLKLAGFTPRTSLIILPLKADAQYEGLLLVWGAGVTRDTLGAFSMFALHVAASLRSARLRAQVDAAHERLRRVTQQVLNVQEEERARLSRELHDEAGQALTALKIDLALLTQDVPADQAALRARLQQMSAQVNQLLDEIRHMAHEMHPPVLETLGLSETLAGYCDSFSQRTQLRVRYEGATSTDVPPSVGISLYRFVQEALTNTARHAEATQVNVQLAAVDGQLTLCVQDDGRGFDVNAHSVGLGLASMRERVEALGGELDIESRIDEGTRITARVPIVK